ncbi:hypothetical protein ACWDTP_23640 [Mycobacterium sp. NPDC003449]
MFGAHMRRVGEIDLSELAAIGRLAGQDGLPYPFAHTRGPGAGAAPAPAPDTDPAFRRWADTYVTADIWLTCRVHHADADVADGRILGFHDADSGYVARQRGFDDVVEIFAVHPGDLGAATAALTGLTRPGTHPRIVVPGYIGYFGGPAGPGEPETDDEDDDRGVAVLTPVAPRRDPDHHTVADADVAAVAIFQSRWRPARQWGVDWTEPVLVAIRIDDDGDYRYLPDFNVAVPVDEATLSARIDAMTAGQAR